MVRSLNCLFLMPLCFALAACSGAASNRADSGGAFEAFVLPDGPKPWLREAGGCYPGQSGGSGGASGSCGGSGASGTPADGAAPDVAPADLPPPDLCIPPTTCAVEFSLAVVGAESTAAVSGDFDKEGAADWTSMPMTRTGAFWRAAIPLANGRKLTYKIVIDQGLAGETWFVDPNNPATEPGPFGDNSVLTVACPNPCL